ncbi:hypothetical protein [Streptomyces aidingensis]|uniref:Uncharacterized protein n=1 Tax=Streptomyces aidingensis TaxID=910347 RepID=A0A1I1FE42_9ACTN|nr:hypothetical protein [Streptomyces aidingensis]SFB97232.1 hypothetical protein SAMN05421773_101686 [Streptomyces aidingensis]
MPAHRSTGPLVVLHSSDEQDQMPDTDDTTPPAEHPDCGDADGCGRR